MLPLSAPRSVGLLLPVFRKSESRGLPGEVEIQDIWRWPSGALSHGAVTGRGGSILIAGAVCIETYQALTAGLLSRNGELGVCRRLQITALRADSCSFPKWKRSTFYKFIKCLWKLGGEKRDRTEWLSLAMCVLNSNNYLPTACQAPWWMLSRAVCSLVETVTEPTVTGRLPRRSKLGPLGDHQNEVKGEWAFKQSSHGLETIVILCLFRQVMDAISLSVSFIIYNWRGEKKNNNLTS